LKNPSFSFESGDVLGGRLLLKDHQTANQMLMKRRRVIIEI